MALIDTLKSSELFGGLEAGHLEKGWQIYAKGTPIEKEI